MKKWRRFSLVLSYVLAILLGLVIAIGLAGAVGLWPEEWRF